MNALVAEDFAVPRELVTEHFRLEPLGERHNSADHAAWTTSIDHIRATPGFDGRSWPPEQGMSLADNLADLRRHADDFARRTGFTYTVIDRIIGDVIGCVYIHPDHEGGTGVVVRSWVRQDRAELDDVLHEVVREWLSARWPFPSVSYPGRDHARI
ncbi:N-acetyltransferase [Saccharopolyspora taberi]|uniref:N-acetyltransferase n=1 Tax=Saccharopolyspora taberi TaxID=60895 RepID=A0ABN3VC74_9PSEU